MKPDKYQTPNENALGAGDTKGAKEGKKGAVRSPDFATDTRLCEAQFAALKAKFAALGHILQRPPTGADYVVTRWGLSRYLANANEALAFLVQIGGVK